MPVQISSVRGKSIPVEVFGYVKSLGFNVFFAKVRTPFNAEVFWRRDTSGDLKDFLRVARSQGVRLDNC